MMDNSIPDTVVCILCHGVIPRSRFKEHMRNEHGAFFDLDFLLASCLMDEDTKESWAKTVRPLEYEELEREETLKENTNYDKDDQTSASVVSEEVESSLAKATEPPLKKRGRKKKAKVPASDISNPKPEKETSGKSYNNKTKAEKKAHGILGPKAAKKQRMSVSTEETQVESLDTSESASEAFNDTPSSGSFLTDTSLGFEEDTDGGEAVSVASQEEEGKAVVGGMDFSSSNYFKKNPRIMNTATEKSIQLFDQENPYLPQGWKQRILTVTTKSGDKVMNKHYLSPELKVLKSGMAVVEYLRIKGDFNNDQLKVLAKDLNIADKKIQSLFSD